MVNAHTLQLIEYYWTGDEYSSTYQVGPNCIPGTLTFDDILPEEVQKSYEVSWRISKLGLPSTGNRRRGTKAKWRKSIKVDWTFTGFCGEEFRKTLEFYANRWSKFRVRYDGRGGQNDSFTAPTDAVFATINPEVTSKPPTFSYEILYVVIISIEFTMTTKPQWYKYTMKLSRVDLKDVVE